MDPLWHLNPLLLPRQFVLQSLPPYSFATQTLGSGLIAHHPIAADHLRRSDGYLRPAHQQRNAFQHLHRRADRSDRFPSRWPGGDFACLAVQWPHERGADFDLLRFVLGS